MSRLAVAAFLLAAVPVAAVEPPKSGVPVGEKIPRPFYPLNVNGESAGEEDCPVCRFGNRPAALVFARHADTKLLGLVRGLEKVAANRQADEFRVCVVVLTDDKEAPKRLAELAKAEGLRHVLLATHSPEGPEDYAVAADADVTALLYVGRKVKANHAFRTDDFGDPAVAAIVADFEKLQREK